MTTANAVIDLSKNGYSVMESPLSSCVHAISNFPAEIISQLPKPLSNGYEWFSGENEREFLDHATGWFIAWQHGLKKQFFPYKVKIIEILAKDMADRVTFLGAQELNYGTLWFKHTNYRLQDLEEFSEYHPPVRSISKTRKWRFRHLKDFDKMVPPHALEALVLLDTHQIVPDSLWVAEEETPRQTSRPDPFLCASFGPYVVALAEWK